MSYSDGSKFPAFVLPKCKIYFFWEERFSLYLVHDNKIKYSILTDTSKLKMLYDMIYYTESYDISYIPAFHETPNQITVDEAAPIANYADSV